METSFTTPGYDYGVELGQIDRKRKLAQALQQQSMQETPQQTAGGWVVPNSPFQGAAKLAQAFASKRMEDKSDLKQKELTDKIQGDYRAMLSRGLSQLQGTSSTQLSEDASGNVTPAQPAVPADPAAALATFGSHPQGAQFAPLAMQELQRQRLAQALGGGMPPQAPISAGTPQEQPGTMPVGAQPQAPQPTPQPAGAPAMTPGSQPQARVPGGPAGGLPMSAWLQIDPSGKLYAEAFAKDRITPFQSAQLAQSDQHFRGVSGNTQAQLAQSAKTLAETTRHHGAIEGDPTTIENTAQAIATGNLAPLSGFALAKPMGQQIMARVMAINPQYSAKDFGTGQKAEKDFATGKPGQAVRSFNVALSHLDTLDSLADALHNGNTQLINKASNMVATQTGLAAPTNFESAKKIVADEIVKAIVGSGGGVTDREAAAKTISAANSPAQLKGVINTYKELMRGQLGGLKQQYETSTGRKDFDRFLSPAGKAQETTTTNPDLEAALKKYGG